MHRALCIRQICLISSALLGFTAATTRAAVGVKYTVTDLGDEIQFGFPVAINDAGKITANRPFRINGGDGPRAILRDPNGMITELGTLGGNFSTATDLNNQGRVVGYSSGFSFGTRPFLWDSAGGMRLVPGPDVESFGRAINDSGVIAGVATSIAWIYDQSGFHSLGTPGGSYSTARDINNLGQVVGRARWETVLDHAFRWDSTSGWRDLGAIFQFSEAHAINGIGEVVGESYTGNGNHAFVWDEVRGIRDLGTLTTGESAALAINDLGEIIGHASGRAVIWDAASGGIADLNTLIPTNSGWLLRDAVDINGLGQIIGMGVGPDAEVHSFLLTPVPEPTWLGATLIVMVAATARRHVSNG